MDFTNHLLQANRLSIIDKSKTITQSTIDYKTTELRNLLRDQTLHAGMVANALKGLGEAQVNSIADYVLRKADNPGRAFVKLCHNELAKRAI